MYLQQPDPPLRKRSIVEVRIVRIRLRYGSVEEPERMWDELLQVAGEVILAEGRQQRRRSRTATPNLEDLFLHAGKSTVALKVARVIF